MNDAFDEFGFNISETEQRLLKELDRNNALRDLGVSMFKVVDLLIPTLLAFQDRKQGISAAELDRLIDLALEAMEAQMEAFEAKHGTGDEPI